MALIGIKGRLQSSEYVDENDKKYYVLEVVTEKVTFLSSRSKSEETPKDTKKNTKKKAVK